MANVSIPSLSFTNYFSEDSENTPTTKDIIGRQEELFRDLLVNGIPVAEMGTVSAWSKAIEFINDLDDVAKPDFDIALDLTSYNWPGTISKPSIEPAPEMGSTPSVPGEYAYPDAPVASNLDEKPTWTDDAAKPSETTTPTAPNSISIPDAPNSPTAAASPGDPSVSSIDLSGAPNKSIMTWQDSIFASFLDLSTDLRDKISLYVNGTETGVDSAVETAISDRALSRLRDERESNYNEAESYWSARGFSMPPGMLAGRLTEIDAEYSKRVSELNNDIYVRQVQDAKEYFWNAVNASIQYGQLDLAGIQAKSQFVVDKFRNLVALYAEQIGARRAQAEIDVAIYQARLERYKTESDVNMAEFAADVEAFKARVSSLATVYEADVSSYKAQSDFYNDRYEALIALYQAERTLDIESFKADIENTRYRNENLMDKDRTKAQVYASEMGAKADVYKSRVQSYQAQVSAVVEKFRGQVQNYQAMIQKYAAEGNINIEQVRAQLEEVRLRVNSDIQTAEIGLKEALEAYRIDVAAIEAKASLMSQMTASTLGMMNISAGTDFSLGFSNSWSNTRKVSASESYDLKETA